MLKKGIAILLAVSMTVLIAMSGFTVSAYEVKVNDEWLKLSDEEVAAIFEEKAQLSYEEMKNYDFSDQPDWIQDQYEAFQNQSYEEYKATLRPFDEYVYLGAHPMEDGYILDLQIDHVDGISEYVEVDGYLIDTITSFDALYSYVDGVLTKIDYTDLTIDMLERIFEQDHRNWLLEVGDCNGDDSIDVADIMYVKLWIMNEYAQGPDALGRFDLSKNGKVDVGDIMALKNIIMKTA